MTLLYTEKEKPKLHAKMTFCNKSTQAEQK